MELETYVMIVDRLGFVPSRTIELLARITELGRMLTSLRQRLLEPKDERTL